MFAGTGEVLIVGNERAPAADPLRRSGPPSKSGEEGVVAHMRTRHARRRLAAQLARSGLAAFAVLAASLVLLEGLVRCFAPPSFATSVSARDADGVERLRPGVRKTFALDGSRVRLVTDGLGLPVSAAVRPRAALGEPVVCVLGDDIAMGLGASDYRNSMVGVAAEELRQAGVHFANLAVAGDDARAMLAKLERDVPRLVADLAALVVVSGCGDRDGKPERGSGTLGANALEERCSLGRVAAWLGERSVAASLLLARCGVAPHPGDEPTWLRQRTACVVPASLGATHAAWEALADACAAREVPVVWVYVPCAPELEAASTERGHVMRSLAERHGHTFLDLVVDLRAASEAGHKLYRSESGLWTEAGHRVAGEALAEVLAGLSQGSLAAR